MEETTFQQLTEQEVSELSLCGISNESQLLRADINTILKDLRTAQKYFPDKHFSLTRKRLESLLGAQVTVEEPAEETESAKEAEEDEEDTFKVENVGPTTGFRRSAGERAKKQSRKNGKAQHRILHSSVRTSHPWGAIFAAMSMLLLVVPALSTVVLSFMLMTNSLPDISLPVLVGIFIIAPSLPYMIFSRTAHCPVCHIRIFSFGNYTRNHSAHHIPGLGYNAAAALNLLFRFRFICPGCGTPIRLTRSKSK